MLSYEGISFRAGGFPGGGTALVAAVESRKEQCEWQDCGRENRLQGKSVPGSHLELEGECLQKFIVRIEATAEGIGLGRDVQPSVFKGPEEGGWSRNPGMWGIPDVDQDRAYDGIRFGGLGADSSGVSEL